MVIALLILSLLGGLAGVSLAMLSGVGLAMGIVAYVAGGMMGTVGFLALIAIRCRLQAAHTTAHPAPQASS